MTNIAVREKGRKTRDKIILAARRVLLEEGYGNFVFRGVALAAGVEPGNVQYYFSSKRDLLWAVLEPELENYQARLESISHHGQSQREIVSETIAFLLTDIQSETTLRLWLAIWAMAAYDEEIRSITGRFYRRYVRTLSASLLRAAPSLDRKRAEETAWLITSQIDGLMAVLSLGQPAEALLEVLEARLVADICRKLE